MKSLYEIDNGYSTIRTVSDALAVLRREAVAARREQMNNERDGFYVKAEHCSIVADKLEALISTIESRAPDHVSAA